HRGPLLACPMIITPAPAVQHNVVYYPTHRPNWQRSREPGNITAYASRHYAQNVGTNDRSVKYYEGRRGPYDLPRLPQAPSSAASRRGDPPDRYYLREEPAAAALFHRLRHRRPADRALALGVGALRQHDRPDGVRIAAALVDDAGTQVAHDAHRPEPALRAW